MSEVYSIVSGIKYLYTLRRCTYCIDFFTEYWDLLLVPKLYIKAKIFLKNFFTFLILTLYAWQIRRLFLLLWKSLLERVSYTQALSRLHLWPDMCSSHTVNNTILNSSKQST